MNISGQTGTSLVRDRGKHTYDCFIFSNLQLIQTFILSHFHCKGNKYSQMIQFKMQVFWDKLLCGRDITCSHIRWHQCRATFNASSLPQQYLGQLKSSDQQQREQIAAYGINSKGKQVIMQLQVVSLHYSERKPEVKLHTMAWINLMTYWH